MDLQRPISIKEMPYTIDIRALLAYAKSKGVAAFNLSDEEKQRFLIPNRQYLEHVAHATS